MIHEYFRVTGAHEAALDYSDLFLITLHGDDVQEFDFWMGRSLTINQSGTLRRYSKKFA